MHEDSLAATNRSDIAKSPSCIPSCDLSLVPHDVDDALSASLLLSGLTSNITGTRDSHRVIQGGKLHATLRGCLEANGRSATFPVRSSCGYTQRISAPHSCAEKHASL